MPGRRKSEVYWRWPVTTARASTLVSERPPAVHCAGGRSGVSSGTSSRIFLPRVSAPNVSERLPAASVTLPSAMVSAAASVRQRSAARASSQLRAVAATRRSCGAIAGVVRLPKVPASNGHRAVSPMTRRSLIGRHRQLVQHRLGQRGAGVLADLDLAGEHRDRAVRGDVQPGAQLLRRLVVGATPRPPPPVSCAPAAVVSVVAAAKPPPPSRRKNARRSTGNRGSGAASS